MASLGYVDDVEISYATRLSFQRAYGFEPDVQLYMERLLDSWQFDITGGSILGPEIDSNRRSVALGATPELYFIDRGLGY